MMGDSGLELVVAVGIGERYELSQRSRITGRAWLLWFVAYCKYLRSRINESDGKERRVLEVDE